MKILVTGGAGYIGSTVSLHLLKAGYEVLVYDNLSHGHRKALPDGVDLIEGDIGDRNLLREVFARQIDGVMHFAAFIEAGESMEDPGKYFENNVAKSNILISESVNAGVKNMIFSSTAAVYQSKNEPLLETDAIGPVNVYGQTKRTIEEMLYWFGSTKGLRSGILRYFNAAGASKLSEKIERGEAHSPETHLIPNIFQVVLDKKEDVTIFGNDYETHDGTCVRDYIHVDDLSVAHILALKALENNVFSYETFNLGNGTGFSNLEVLEMARKVTGHEIPMKIGGRRQGDAARLVASSRKASEVLGWTTSYGDLETIISSAWEWHKSHPDGYEA